MRKPERCAPSALSAISVEICTHSSSHSSFALRFLAIFPSSEIFQCLTSREELLRGMLCADHIGFHLFEWAKNFLACCRRLLACTFEAKRGGGLVVARACAWAGQQ